MHALQILRGGGESLAEEVEALKATASRQSLALAKQRAATARAEAQIAELVEATAELGGRYASAQVRHCSTSCSARLTQPVG